MADWDEPDCIWQDGVTPDRYAEVYHELYYFLKQRDLSCRISISAISQSTPLRLQYLDAILNRYTELYDEKMPVDVWNAYNFMLREEKGSWGAEIPPDIQATQGILYEIEDSGNLEAFKWGKPLDSTWRACNRPSGQRTPVRREKTRLQEPNRFRIRWLRVIDW